MARAFKPAASEARVRVIGHRGAAGLAPENTMAAFRAAAAAGADMFEIDVQLSADGVPVIVHDDALERTTDIARHYADWDLHEGVPVSSLPRSRLEALDAGSWFVDTDPFGTIAAGIVTARRAEAYRGERIPALADALRFAEESGLAVNVEIKQIPRYYDGIAEAVAAAAGAMRNKQLVLVSSFDHEVCRRVLALDPKIAIGVLCGSRLADPGRYVAEVVGGSAYNVWRSALGCDDGRPATAALAGAADIAATQRRGIAVNVWTVDDPAAMERLIRAGVDGIVTNRPDVLRKVLQAQEARSKEKPAAG